MTTARNITKSALESLALLGHQSPETSLQTMRAYLQLNGAPPALTLRALAARHRLLCLGEMHDFAGRYMSADLVTAAAAGGANTLFIEVYSCSQPAIDEFMATGLHALLPLSAGGGSTVPMRFQRPYVDMMHAARRAGMQIVAIDREGVSSDERDLFMAETVAEHLRDPARRGVAIVGQLHLLPRLIFGRGTTMASYLWPSLGGEMVKVGRAVPDPNPEFSVWADVGAVDEPLLMQTAGSPWQSLHSTRSDESMRCDDFDHVFFYPGEATKSDV